MTEEKKREKIKKSYKQIRPKRKVRYLSTRFYESMNLDIFRLVRFI